MSPRHVLCILLLTVVAALIGVPDEALADPCAGIGVIDQPFPTPGTERVRWNVSACSVGAYGLVIGRTTFKKSPAATPIQIFHDARVVEVFVPYHPGSPRFLDLSVYSSGLMTLNTTECPTLLILGGKACAEVRDRGLAFKDDGPGRRGQDLVIWGVQASANYKYLQEWRFRDDGIIVARVTPTGRNLLGLHETTHQHTTTWRLDIDLNGPNANSVFEGKHVEVGLMGIDSEIQLTRETSRQWRDVAFTYWSITDATLRNSQNHPTAYRLVPLRSGSTKHAELWTRPDFWVTKLQTKNAQFAPPDLLTYVQNRESVVNTDIVVWYTGGVHHIPRDEDDTGATGVVMDAGFMLVPFNLFDTSPYVP